MIALQDGSECHPESPHVDGSSIRYANRKRNTRERNPNLIGNSTMIHHSSVPCTTPMVVVVIESSAEVRKTFNPACRANTAAKANHSFRSSKRSPSNRKRTSRGKNTTKL